MDHHASLGRRKLEEIRQKRAAQSTESGNEKDHLEAQLVATQVERDDLRKELDGSLQQIQLLNRELSNTTDLKQTLKTLSVERDAALMAKEDLLAQLRLTRRRLQEAEEEQYKAEEDAAVLRAELKHLQQEHSGSSQSLHLQEQYGYADQEIKSMREELQDAVFQLQQQQQLLANEEQKVVNLTAEKKELELALASSRSEVKEIKQATAAAETAMTGVAENKWRSKVDRGKHEQDVRELASMVERLESGRQKLLSEIDLQSIEIEKLFMENAGLVNGLNETSEIAARWERQLHETMKQNTDLRRTVEDLKMDQVVSNLAKEGPEVEFSEVSKLKVDLTKALGERDQLAEQISQLTLELASATHKLNGFHRLYGPILSSLETRLLQIKQNTYSSF